VVTGTVISSTTFNTLTSDLATALSTTVCKDGQQAITANITMSGFKLTNLAAATAVADAPRTSQVQNSGFTYLTGTAGTNTITASATPTPAAYAAGQSFEFVPAVTNTGATTLNVSSLGAKNVFANGAACVGGELVASVPCRVFYDGTQFNIIGQNRILAGEPSNSLHAVPARDVLGWITGLTYANNSGDATNDIDIATGAAIDSTGAYVMRLASALTKRLDASWVVGTNQGGILSGSAANVDYNIWLIARSDTGVVDVGFETTANATPTLPTSYDKYRKIGWFKRVGGTIVAFHTYELEGGGLELSWDTPTLDVNLANTLTTSRRTDAVKVPLDFSVIALLSINMTDASSGFAAVVECPDHADVAVGSNSPEVGNVGSISTSAPMQTERWVRTSATGTIAARASLATVDTYQVSTFGFRWARR
jgi:hypothetical protein